VLGGPRTSNEFVGSEEAVVSDVELPYAGAAEAPDEVRPSRALSSPPRSVVRCEAVTHWIPTARWRAWLCALLAACVGCTDGEACPDSTCGDDGTPPVTCAKGSVVGPSGACMPVGIQGCADVFVDDDGLCRPALSRCAKGSIPKFDEGCAPVGIPGCASEFVTSDGQCRPPKDACPEGSFALPHAGCVSIDGPKGCGTGAFGEVPDAPNTVYVDGAAPAGGDGTKASPFATIAAALAEVPTGGRVVLAAGDYDEPVVIGKPLSLLGRCASMVGIRGTAASTIGGGLPAIVQVRKTAGVVLEGVRLSGQGIGVLADAAGVTVRDVVVTKARVAGIFGVGKATSLTLERTLVADTSPRASDMKFGRGLLVEFGAKAQALESAFVGNHDLGVWAAEPGTSVTLDRCLVADTRPRPSDELAGRGAEAASGASLKLARTAVLRNHDAGVLAIDEGTSLVVADSLVADTAPQASDQTFGRGVGVELGASAEVSRSAVVGNHEAGVLAVGDGTSLVVERSLVADTQPQPKEQVGGRGVEVSQQARATLRASAIVGNRELGVRAAGTGTELEVDGCLVAETHSRPADQQFGRGVGGEFGASLKVVGSAVVANQEVGVWTTDMGTNLVLERSLVDDTQPLAEATLGMGVNISTSAATIKNVLVARSRTGGFLFASSTGSVEDSLVDGVVAGSFHLYVGPPEMEVITATFQGISDGVVAGFGSTVSVTNVLIRGVARAGLVFDSSGGLLRGLQASGGKFGLVLQGNPKPDVSDPTNRITGSEDDVLSDAELPIPGPPKVPSG